MRIAVVGAGVSGLVAAHLLHREHELTVFEAGSYAGGHTNTIAVPDGGRTLAVDTGFIVMNDRNYPNFTRILDRLGVARQPTHMSFSVSSPDGAFEYAGTPRGLFCQRRNLTSGAFRRMIRDLLRFNRELRAMLARPDGTGAEEESLQAFLARGGYSEYFVERLIRPQVAAVWSAEPSQLESFPVRFLAEFFANHGMLGFRDRPAWSTIAGGSARYVEALTAPFRDRIRLSSAVTGIERRADGVELSYTAPDGSPGRERFEQVIIAAHSDQALAMLRDPSEREREILGAIRYQPNEAVLHTDARLLPQRRAARAAWNYRLVDSTGPRSTVTYWMNHLQRLQGTSADYCVTLNMTEAIDPQRIIRRIDYAHPVFTPAAVRAQSRHAEISATERRTHYCGAYWGWGFHEDGVRSALAACEPLGGRL